MSMLKFQNASESVNSQPDESSTGKPPLILVADDDHDMVKALRIRLEDYGFKVVTAKDSYNALASSVDKAPDLLILDINMPAGDGFSVQDRLSKIDPRFKVPVIYITGDKSLRLDSVAQEYGAAALFHKPIDMNKMVETIREVLKPKAA